MLIILIASIVGLAAIGDELIGKRLLQYSLSKAGDVYMAC